MLQIQILDKSLKFLTREKMDLLEFYRDEMNGALETVRHWSGNFYDWCLRLTIARKLLPEFDACC